MKILWLFYIKPVYLDFFGSLFGATIGIIGVYLSAVLTARHTQKRDRELARQDEAKKRLADEAMQFEKYRQATIMAEMSLGAYIAQASTNLGHLYACLDLANEQAFNILLPRPILFDKDLVYTFQNTELTREWLNLSLQTQRIDEQIEDFRTFYRRIDRTIHAQQITIPSSKNLTDHINADVVLSDYETITEYCRHAIGDTELLIKRYLDLLALVTAHLRTSRRKLIDPLDLIAYKVSPDTRATILKELGEEMDLDRIFVRHRQKPAVPPLRKRKNTRH